ncbi:MAG: NAD(P)-dependent alcohol dehydrogenase [Acidobacteriota bacterium]
MKIHAYAASRPRARLEAFDYEPGPLGAGEIEIAISHCGICHSDVHLVDGDWGDVFPVVPGHEIIGTVVAGDGFAPGQRVGVGWQRGSCGQCEWCAAGEEELCPASQATCMGNFGGFADRVRAKAPFVIPIPAELQSETAAPLLCGGITVYSPLKRYAGAGARVGVIGIGGLGHLALQLARAMGCEVTAFSRLADKEADAHRFGAHHFSTGLPAPRSLDLVLNTAHAVANMDAFLTGLRPRGVFCQLGAAPEPLVVPAMHLIMGRRTVCGSAIGSPGAIREMLALAARGGVKALAEVVPMSTADEALDRTRRNSARYRMVLAS